MFDNNFGKCGPIFKILSLINSRENSLYVNRPTPKIYTSPSLPCEILKSKNVAEYTR